MVERITFVVVVVVVVGLKGTTMTTTTTKMTRPTMANTVSLVVSVLVPYGDVRHPRPVHEIQREIVCVDHESVDNLPSRYEYPPWQYHDPVNCDKHLKRQTREKERERKEREVRD